MSEVKQFRLPDVGEGLTEADIVSWHVKPGDAVKVNQVIVEIETAKAVVELPCPFEGIVTGLLVDEGANVAVGTPIIAVNVAPDADSAGDRTATAGVPAGAGDRPAAGDVPAGSTPAGTSAASDGDLVPSPPPETAVEPGIHGSPAPKVERQAVLVGYGVRLGTTKRRQRKNALRRRGSASGCGGIGGPGAHAVDSAIGWGGAGGRLGGCCRPSGVGERAGAG